MSADDSIPPEPWLSELERRLSSSDVLAGEEGVHQLRVAAGRLQAWLDLGGRRALRDDLRRLRRTVAGLRDGDVLLARRSGVEDTRDLAAGRERELERARESLQRSRPEALLRALGFVPWPSAARAERRLSKLAKRALRSADALVAGERDPLHLHQLRRRVRRVRYDLEWLGRASDFARELQDALGAWHDATLDLERSGESFASGDDGTRDRLEREVDALVSRAAECHLLHRARWRDLARSRSTS